MLKYIEAAKPINNIININHICVYLLTEGFLCFAISGPPTINGNKKLPNPPIIAGMTIKNIIRIACAVIMLLYNWLSAIYCTPGPDNSRRIRTENDVPINPENNANIKYNVPISFALDERNHLSFHIVISVMLLNILDFSFSPNVELISCVVE